MSYLQVPRLVFGGKFISDAPTTNNIPPFHNLNIFNPDMHQFTWNSGGSGAFKLYGCRVQRVYYKDGTYTEDPALDPVIGMPINGADSQTGGKMADLDPDQALSEVWGLQVVLGETSGIGFSSNLEVAVFNDSWIRYTKSVGDRANSTFYQSVLHISRWQHQNESRYLRELAAANPGGAVPDKLSIKFILDGFQSDATSPDFTFGRLVGSIGAYHPQEPVHFVAGRTLQQVFAGLVNFNTAYFVIDEGVLHLDLGNSLPTEVPGGELFGAGGLFVEAIPLDGAPPVLLGEAAFKTTGWYEKTAGIISIPLVADRLALASKNPLVIRNTVGTSLTAIVLKEREDGIAFQPDQTIFRLNPGEQQSTRLHVTAFGKPLPNYKIKVSHDPSFKKGFPDTAIQFPTTLTTGADGTVTLPLKATDPGMPRGPFMDGQSYRLSCWSASVSAALAGNPRTVSVRIYSGYTVPETPTWIEHVQPIFQQYANLYPVMKPIVDLSNYAEVLERLHIIKNVFRLPITSPNYMPVTRDLSGPKLTMIRKWLENPLYMKIDTVAQLKQVLQIAIMLEHATIPPYLAALYSIKPGYNVEVASLIRSIVMEEMLHMALVANLLIAIGGNPDLKNPAFIPDYPAALPGGLRAGLTLQIRRCSIEHIRDVFMEIEEPEEIIKTKYRARNPNWEETHNLYTIGWFYDEIKKALTALHNAGKLTFGHANKQVKDWSGPGQLLVINNLQDALKAIEQIKDQGEGTSVTDPGSGDGELAHYYKFAEIVHGAHLVRNGTEFSYTGAKIPFDPDGVWPMADNPDPFKYKPGSVASTLANQFTEAYIAMVNGLHRVFNGEPEFLTEAVGTMYNLSLLARKLMQTPSGLEDGTTAGPNFKI
ncbi:ferritin-like domain-containing protein [Chitinophaga nivalis]|uniref:Ferritin-like protein n=1 Tax=Chitinophaga nivalis TaxID=2991709 RepID=A0ABT3IJ11_9BACT|nr:ferritin-like protein [Chitinophaga nivalis]MCW3466356.1 ferritin-like protein [Chitinophaga nivalis]MCW3483953.1 ferritin-like protein [Chitinophaga nivalis]